MITELGVFPDNWEIKEISDVLEEIIDYRGKTPAKSDEGIVTLSAKSVKQGYIDYSNVYYVSKDTYDKFMVRGFPQVGDILLTTEAPLGCLARLDRDDVCLAQRLITLRGKRNKVLNDYIYYYLQSSIGQHELKSRATGTTVIGIKRSEFNKVRIVLPPIEEQKKIVLILNYINRKIELNNKLNSYLEEMAMCIFQQRFSEEEVSNVLSDYAEIVMGQSPKGDTYNENGEGTVFYQGRAEFTWRYPKRRLFTTEPKRMAKENTVLMSVRAPVGDINIANEECCIGRGLASIVSKTGHQSFVIYLMKSLKRKLDIYNGEGTVFGSINKETLSKLPVSKFDKDAMDEFEKLVTPIDKQIRIFCDQNSHLIELRDILLEKLMNGELDLSDTQLDI